MSYEEITLICNVLDQIYPPFIKTDVLFFPNSVGFNSPETYKSSGLSEVICKTGWFCNSIFL